MIYITEISICILGAADHKYYLNVLMCRYIKLCSVSRLMHTVCPFQDKTLLNRLIVLLKNLFKNDELTKVLNFLIGWQLTSSLTNKVTRAILILESPWSPLSLYTIQPHTITLELSITFQLNPAGYNKFQPKRTVLACRGFMRKIHTQYTTEAWSDAYIYA